MSWQLSVCSFYYCHERWFKPEWLNLIYASRRPELESIGVDHFGRSRSWSRLNFAYSDSGPELQDATRQQKIILTERICIVPKTLKDGKKRKVAVRS